MKLLTQYGRLAERHWREYCPKLVAALEVEGRLQEMLLQAEEKTDEELDLLCRQLLRQGLTPQQAYDRAWEMVRERYIFLPPEN